MIPPSHLLDQLLLDGRSQKKTEISTTYLPDVYSISINLLHLVTCINKYTTSCIVKRKGKVRHL